MIKNLLKYKTLSQNRNNKVHFFHVTRVQGKINVIALNQERHETKDDCFIVSIKNKNVIQRTCMYIYMYWKQWKQHLLRDALMKGLKWDGQRPKTGSSPNIPDRYVVKGTMVTCEASCTHAQ